MGKLAFILNFILAAFPTDQFERRHIHVILPGKLKRKKRGDVVAKIWIEKDGERCVEVDWSSLSAAEEQVVLRAINENIVTIENQLTKIFSGEKVRILKLK